MNDKTIMKVCFVMVIIGIIGLFIVTNFSTTPQVRINSIDETKTGQIVSISGIVSSYYTSEGHVFMNVNDSTGTIKVVMFQKDAENNPWVYDIRKDDKVTINGKIQLYKGELEIVASSVKVI
jgi:aspartyl/asparaginyl-tRNA synthetase